MSQRHRQSHEDRLPQACARWRADRGRLRAFKQRVRRVRAGTSNAAGALRPQHLASWGSGGGIHPLFPANKTNNSPRGRSSMAYTRFSEVRMGHSEGRGGMGEIQKTTVRGLSRQGKRLPDVDQKAVAASSPSPLPLSPAFARARGMLHHTGRGLGQRRSLLNQAAIKVMAT